MKRRILDRSLLKHFAEFLLRRGFTEVKVSGDYQEIGFRRFNEHGETESIILYSRKGRDELTVPTGIATEMLDEFLEARRKK